LSNVNASIAAPEETLVSADLTAIRKQIREIWRFRELLYFFVWKELKVRYRQTVMGAGWAVLQPLIMMIVFTIFFGKLARLPSNGIPYPLFYFSALVPWQYLSVAVGQSANTLVANQNLVKKVYFPRLLLPLASVSAGLPSLAASHLLLFGMALFYGAGLGIDLLLLPLLLVVVIFTALLVGVWSSALNAVYRDVRFAIPLGLQTWLFLSPVAYPSSLVPEQWRSLYRLNPMAGVIEGYRWAITGAGRAPGIEFLASIGIVLVLLVIGVRRFWRVESTFADVV
jgi:lipopolysaccharide transport system permease protein